jgi:hypothetical protein
MAEKGDLLRYLIIGVVLIILIGLLLVIRWKTGFSVITGYAVYEQGNQTEFNSGTYVNTTYNGSAIVLAGSNLTGSYISKIFDAGNDAIWNNLSYVGQIQAILNYYLTSAIHNGVNRTQVFALDENYYYAQMRNDNEKFSLNFTNSLKNSSILKIYAKKDSGTEIRIFAQSDSTGTVALGKFIPTSVTGEYYNITLNMSGVTNAIWIGEGLLGNSDPKAYFDYLYAEIPGTNLTFQVRNCSSVDCSDGAWQTVNLENINLIARYFQYKVDFTSPDSSITPDLSSVSIDYTILNSAPSISLINPQEGTTYGYNTSIALNYSVSDLNLASCWHNINNGNNMSLSNCDNTTFSVSGNGNYILNIYANDSFGLVSSDSVNFSVQVGSPTIVLSSPIDSYLNNPAVIFSYAPTDIDLQVCELWVNFDGEFKLNQTDNSPDNGIENTFNLNLSDGTYLWNIRCNDSAGNYAFNGNKTFYVDTINPSVSLTQPTGAKTSRIVSASWSVSDANLNSCWYNVYRGASLELANTSVNCSLNNANFDVTVDANFVFNFYVNDSAGNSNSAGLSFSVSTSTPVIPSSGGSSGGGGGSVTNATQLGKLSVSLIGSIIAREGDKKTLSLNAKNIGRIFLNNCRLISKGDISSWIYSTNIYGIAPGQNVNFIFDLNVPEEIATEINTGILEIKCEEASHTQNISVSMPKEAGLIEIKDVNQEDGILKINYVFDSSKFVGDNIDINIWLADENGTEIKRIADKSPLNTGGFIERNVEMQLPEDLVGGVYFIYFAFSNDEGSFIKKSVVLGVTGRAVLDSEKGKFWVYILFLLILAVAIFFIWRRHGREENSNSSKHKWLLRKKAIAS